MMNHKAANFKLIDRHQQAFTLIEALVVLAIIALLTGILLPALASSRASGMATVCTSNIRQLATANLAYTNDHNGNFVHAAEDIFDDLGDGHGGHWRWHGYRENKSQSFDVERGPLGPYFEGDGRIKQCPAFDDEQGGGDVKEFELGTGGYGYNNHAIGARNDKFGYSPKAAEISAKLSQVSQPMQTVMFTDTAIAQKDGQKIVLSEYSFCEAPLFYQSPKMFATPTIHFRHLDSTNIAWVDGHVKRKMMNFTRESVYGLTAQQMKEYEMGWFGPENNELFDLK